MGKERELTDRMTDEVLLSLMTGKHHNSPDELLSVRWVRMPGPSWLYAVKGEVVGIPAYTRILEEETDSYSYGETGITDRLVSLIKKAVQANPGKTIVFGLYEVAFVNGRVKVRYFIGEEGSSEMLEGF